MRRSEGVAASWPRLTGGVGSAIGFGAAIVAKLHRFGELRLDATSRSALVLLLTVGVAASLLGLAATGQASRAGRSPAGRPVERAGVRMVISHTGSRHRKCSMPPRRAEPRPAGPIRPSRRPDRSGWPVG